MQQKIRIKIRSITNETYLPYLEDPTETQVFFGGAGSGKSVFLARRAVLDVAKHARNYLIARATQRSIRQSTWNEITDAIDFLGLSPYFDLNKSELTCTCKYNDRQIVFVGTDKPERLKSIRPKSGSFTDYWAEEATEIAEPADKQLRIRCRGGDPSIVKRKIYSFNPIFRGHWIHKRFFLGLPDDVREHRDQNLVVLRTTHQDNRWLTAQDHAEIEAYKHTDPYYYQVYALGLWGVIGHVLFRNWEARDIGEAQYDYWRNGLDFGFSADPCALSRSTMRGDTIFVPRMGAGELYQAGLTIPQLAKELKLRLHGSDVLYCDSAEPRSITELRDYGINTRSVTKGRDSLLHGIQWLQQKRIVVDMANQHAINELSTARWKSDKDGNAIRQPEDKNNHWLDATRYAYESEMHSTKVHSGRYAI